MTRPTAPRQSVLFCPFCGESFEDVARCPDHDLPLVAWQELASSGPAAHDADGPVARFSPRHGRALLFASSAATLLAFLSLPLGHVQGDARYGGSLVSLALHGAHRLWLVPTGALALGATVLRRRTRAGLRAAAVALCLLALVPPLGASWAWAGSRDAIAALAAQRGEALTLVPGAGLWAAWLLTLPALYAIFRLVRYSPGGRSESGR